MFSSSTQQCTHLSADFRTSSSQYTNYATRPRSLVPSQCKLGSIEVLKYHEKSADARMGTRCQASGIVEPSALDAIPIAIGALGLGLGLLKVMAYSQLEVVRTAMLSRHVKQGSATVLQLGGTTRDLYYYPSGTLQITVNSPDISKGLFQQAGMTVGVPVEATSLPLVECLAKTPSSSVDSVVSFEQFGGLCSTPSELKSITAEIARILKPGGTFIFYQRLANGGFAQVGARAPGCPLNVGEIIAQSEDLWDFCEYDVAAASLDAHDVGVCVKSLDRNATGPSSVDESSFEQLLQRQRRLKKKKQK